MPSPQTMLPKKHTPRARRTVRGWLARLVLMGSFVVLALLSFVMASGWRPWLKRDRVVQPATTTATTSTKTTTTTPQRTRSAAGDAFATAARQAAQGVVAIQTVGQGNIRNLGAGFVIDRRGWVVTNFHVVSTATEAQVRLVDGRVFRVAGYAAAWPARDLALLQLESPPEDLWPLTLADTQTRIQPASQVMAIGHPRGVQFVLVDGRVSRWVQTHELDSEAQHFVRRLIHGEADLKWLQHTASLAEGNSGGPLLDVAGQVVGINTWVSRETGANYALDVRYLIEALDQRDETPVQPLAELATIDVQAAAIVARLTSQRVNQLFAEAEALQWLPASKDEYRPFQELALAMVSAHLPDSFHGDRFDRERADELARTVTGIEAQLRKRAGFGSPEQITIVNEQAESALALPQVGVFFFGQVTRVVSNDQGQRGMLMQLIGSQQPVFVPLNGHLLEPEVGEMYAVFGVNLRGDVVRYGDNPLQLTAAPVIVSRTLIEIIH